MKGKINVTNHIEELSLRQAALISGIAILIMTIAAVVATDLTIGSLVVPDDATATFNNITTSEMLFRTGILSWIIILICDIIAAWGLYIFLKPVNASLSLIMAWLRLVYAAILGTAILHFVDVLLLIGNDGYLTVLGSDRLQAQVLLSANGFYEQWAIGLVVFGFHILILGYLILRSDYIPKYWGILLIIAFFGYLLINLFQLLLPEYEHIRTIMGWIFIIPMLSEVGLGIWLLIKGTKVAGERN